MTLSLIAFGAIAAIVLAWALARLLRAQRLGRSGFDAGSEDSRLRDDPRFTEAWVKQLRDQHPPSARDQRPDPSGRERE